MNTYLTIKTIHIIGATFLFGTGIGIAFFMLCSLHTKDLDEKLFASRNTVLADYLFILPAIVLQPLTGAWLVWKGGFSWLDMWLVATYVLYLIAGVCWLPVVWIQIRLKNILIDSVAHGTGLPDRYEGLFKIWILLGVPAFIALVIVFFLMVMKPV